MAENRTQRLAIRMQYPLYLAASGSIFVLNIARQLLEQGSISLYTEKDLLLNHSPIAQCLIYAKHVKVYNFSVHDEEHEASLDDSLDHFWNL